MWILASYMNHELPPNTLRMFVGPMIFVFAATDLPVSLGLSLGLRVACVRLVLFFMGFHVSSQILPIHRHHATRHGPPRSTHYPHLHLNPGQHGAQDLLFQGRGRLKAVGVLSLINGWVPARMPRADSGGRAWARAGVPLHTAVRVGWRVRRAARAR